MLVKCSAVGLVGLCRFAFALLAFRRVTRNVVVSPTTVVDAARIQRARMLGELCYTIPGSSLPADKRRAERFATQYLGVAA